MQLNYQPSSIWDEKSWRTDSFLSASSLYKIQTGWTSYGSFTNFDFSDFYEITPGFGTFKLVVTSNPLNSSGYQGSWGAFSTNFDIKIKDSLGNLLLTTDLFGSDIYTDSITFTSSSFNSFFC
jgi:hypothetical protein